MNAEKKNSFIYDNYYPLSYVETGDPMGFPILIQHGMVASILDQYLFEHLIQAGCRLISIARPGYGESSPFEMKTIGEWGKIVSCLVEELNLVEFDVFGISSGAPYAYSIANALPRCVRNVYILSGIPALYDDRVASAWPYPVNRNASITEMQELAHDLFFLHLTPEDLKRNDIMDSMKNDCFGPALDLRIRGMDWGFRLQDVRTKVIMQQSQSDNLLSAQLTASLLPNGQLKIMEGAKHFSQKLLDDFIDSVILGYRTS